MEDNKLVYPIGFDVQQGMKDALSQLGEFDKKIAQVLGKTPKSVIPKEFNLEVNSFKDNIRILTKEWNNLTAAQRSGAAGQRVLKQFNDLRTSAGAYAGTLNQAAKNQIKLATSTTATNTGLNRQSRIVSQLTSQIGMYVSVYALQRFATAVRDITAEFELQRVALTAILQDKAAADKIFGQVVELALESPFRIKNIISYTKQLAAYRVETDKLFDTTKRLADISAGLGVDMSRLVLAYGQVRAASVLRGQELRQFTEAGIPLVKLLADKFTELRGVMVSTGEVFELISKRAVPFRMIEEIFNDMTDAGGMFYNMQKIQAETLHGVWANLRDAYDKMYYELGQKNMGLLKGLGNFLRSLADNWEAVYISIKTVVSGYLSYLAVSKLVLASTKVLTIAQIAEATASGRQVKATLAKTLSTTFATKAADLHTAAQLRAAVATNVLSRAFWKLTAAIMANPIAAAIGLFVAAGTIIAGFTIKANDLDNIIKKLSKSTSEYNKINDEIKPALETYGDLNKIAAKSEDQTKKQANALATLAQKYPAAITKVDEYGRAIEVSAEMVSKLMLAEEELEKQRIENSNKELLRQKAILVSKMNSLKADINSGYYTQTLSGREGGSQRLPMTPSLLAAWNKEIGELGVRVQKIDVALKGTGSAAAGVIEESLAGLKKYVFELESLEKRAGGNKIKLYDAKEDVSAFGSNIELLEDVAKKYDEASKHAKFYYEQVTNPKISESERETYKNDLRIANAEKELARNILDRYKALDLIKKLKAGDGETEYVKRLREEINVAKDARAAYENYLKTMTEVRAKQTLEGQLKFAGLNFDISDAGAYREYLQNIYDNIKGDPNYDAVRKLIEDIFVDLDTNAIERELKIKLNKIANDIEKTQKANDFFEKVLGITGDIELSKAITIKFTGVAAGEVGDKLREQLQETLQTALGDQALDISGLDILQIEELINKIPDTMTNVKDKAKSFFDKFSDYIRETKIEALELDEKLKLLGMDDSALFGTGVVIDVQKVVRDLSMANKKLAKEKAQLEAEVAADGRANDKKWYDERMKYIDDSFRRSMANERALSREKINDLAKTYVEEQMFNKGISDSLKDVGDKTYEQLSMARKMLESLSETDIVKISDDTQRRIEDLGYTLDEFLSADTASQMFEDLGGDISDTEKSILTLLWTMKQLGIVSDDVAEKIKEILSGKIMSAREEEMKKLMQEIDNIADGLKNLSSFFTDIFDVDSEIASGIEIVIENMGRLVITLIEVSEAAKKASTTGLSMASKFTSAFSAALAILTALLQIFNTIEENEKQSRIDKTTARLEGVEAVLERLSLISNISDGWFSDDAFNKIKTLNEQLEMLLENVIGYADGIYGVVFREGDENYEQAEKYYKLLEKIRNSSYLLGDLGGMGYENLVELRTELAKLAFDSNQTDYIRDRDALIELIDKAIAKREELMSALESFVGDISGNMRSKFHDAWEEIQEGGVAAFGKVGEAIREEVGSALKEMVSQKLWSSFMQPYFDRLGADLEDAILGDSGIADFEKIFSDFWVGAKDGLSGFQLAWESFVKEAEANEWNMFGDIDMSPEDSISGISNAISKLKEEYDNLSKAQREGDYGAMLLLQIEGMEDALRKIEDAAAAADSRISKLLDGEEDRRRQAELLLLFARNTTDQYERQYALQKRQEILAEEHANLYSQYAPDAQAFEDELSKMNDDLEWAIENGYPELAKWIEQAFDTKILDDWRSKLEEAMSGKSDIDQYKYLQSKIEETQKEYVIAASTGYYDNATRLWEMLSEMRDQLEDVRQGILDDLYTKYSSDEQKYLAELKEYSDAIGFAVGQGWIDVAKMIESAMKEYKLDYWSDGIGDELEAMDSYVDKLSFIDSELAKLEGLTATGIDGTYENMQYNDLLEQRGKILDGLYDSYQTERESYEENIKVLEDVKKAFEAVGDMVKADYIQSLIDQATYDYNLDGLEKEFEKQFGDISDMGTDEVKKMLDAFKQQIEDSDISEEQKKKILEDIDDIYDELDRRTQEAFNNIADAIRSIKSLLETVGADKAIVDSFGAIADAIGIIGDLTYAIASGDWWNVFNLAIKLINATISAIKNLVQYLKGDPFAGVEAIGVRITNAEKAVQKAVGTSVKPAQESLLSAYQDAIDELNKGIAEEEAKPDGFFAKLFGLDTDEEAIAKAKEQIADYEDLMEEVRESMKADFLQTDYASFSDSLAEILIQPWDSYMEMMDAVNELTDDTINNIVRHALSLHLQSQIKDALDALYERGIGDESLELFRQDVAKIVKDGQSVAKYYGQFYDDLASSSEAYDTISRITESQANSFLGYYQNYLIIMTDMHNIMKRIWDNMNRQSVNINLDAHLTALHTIAANTGAIANNTSRIGAMADDIKIMKNSLARSGAY